MPIESLAQDKAHPLPLVIQRHAHSIRLITSPGEPPEEARDHQAPPAPHFATEEVCDHEDVPVDTEKLLPGGSLLALRGWENPMAFALNALRADCSRRQA